MLKILATGIWLAVMSQIGFTQNIDPDDVEAAKKLLQEQRQTILANTELSANSKANKLLRLGAWEEAKNVLKSTHTRNDETELIKAHYLFLNNEFEQAETTIATILQKEPLSRRALLLKVRLLIEAWSLQEAAQICRELLNVDEFDEEAALLLGRIKMLEKDYKNALEWAKKVQEWNAANARAYLLESDVHFWNQKPALAEKPLRKCLSIDPFNADARFNYGYMIWRRVDATQLDDMAAQWELALDINPLHYVTHWHWGNGHTNLTYADYIQPTDEEVREELQLADSLVSANKIPEGIALTYTIEKKYPQSVLPAMLRGSAYYMAFDMDRKTRLDSAQAIFLSILDKKQHYGPAHNALAAVIKQKRISYLAAFDSLNTVIDNTEITDPENFEKIFPDVSYYPGDRVQKMVWMQLYASTAYFPLLAKMNRQYVIPPLHVDLAIAMKSNYFRQATTFDNRQWMDIRGVGSGASGIEYVVRGAYLERNVVLHEYTHLYHGRVFTDTESRRVRQLYHNAMANNLTLDYYSANNESEYLAQTYPAYFEPVKVHPLNHKSINTTSDLELKDPQLYAFLDSLVQKQKAFLAGDSKAFASNWAEIYTSLSQGATRRTFNDSTASLALAYLDTALTWDSGYLPTHLQFASVHTRQQDFNKAEKWLNKAEKIDPDYAPVYLGFAELIAAKFKDRKISRNKAIQLQEQYYRRAYSLEKDFAIRAQINREFREFYQQNAMFAKAIEIAEDYVKNASTVSTYLRDRRDEALAFANWVKGSLGYAEGPVAEFERLVSLKPQHYYLRGYFADVLAANGQYKKAIDVLEEALRIQRAARGPDEEFLLRVAEYHLALNDPESARDVCSPILNGEIKIEDGKLRLARIYAGLGEMTKADEKLAEMDTPDEPLMEAEFYFSRGVILGLRHKPKDAIKAYKKAIQVNPYHHRARLALIETLMHDNKKKEALKIADEVEKLSLKPGPAFGKLVDEIVNR